jgi:hypothetical protein
MKPTRQIRIAQLKIRARYGNHSYFVRDLVLKIIANNLVNTKG